MVTLWKSGKAWGTPGSGVQGREGVHSPAAVGICSDSEWERFSMKLFFLEREKGEFKCAGGRRQQGQRLPLGALLRLLLRQLLLQRPLPVFMQADGTVLLHGVQRHGVLGVLLLER